MKHIRINGHLEQVDFQLGSGLYDKTGREIFEGDNIKHGAFDFVHEVTLIKGALCLDGMPLFCLNTKAFKIVDD